MTLAVVVVDFVSLVLCMTNTYTRTNHQKSSTKHKTVSYSCFFPSLSLGISIFFAFDITRPDECTHSTNNSIFGIKISYDFYCCCFVFVLVCCKEDASAPCGKKISAPMIFSLCVQQNTHTHTHAVTHKILIRI